MGIRNGAEAIGLCLLRLI